VKPHSLPLAPRSVPSAATPRPEEGVVSWNINTACNYRCSYCTQRFKDDRGRWLRDTPRFLAAFARLDGAWEVKLSGGEPFVHPTLEELVGGLAAQGKRIGIVTNLSSNEAKLERFVAAADGRLSMISASLHLEYVDDVASFVRKAAWLATQIAAARRCELPRPSLHVTCVATRANLPRLEDLRRRFGDAGLTFKIQPEKQDREVVVYEPSERAQLIALGGHNLTGAIAHDFEGQPCWSGSRYFILDDEGIAYRCYPARRYRIERMGSFFAEDFRLAEEPSPCLYRYCNCTVPIARRMMPVAPSLEGEA